MSEQHFAFIYYVAEARNLFNPDKLYQNYPNKIVDFFQET